MPQGIWKTSRRTSPIIQTSERRRRLDDDKFDASETPTPCRRHLDAPAVTSTRRLRLGRRH
jgi:hypothetical protein